MASAALLFAVFHLENVTLHQLFFWTVNAIKKWGNKHRCKEDMYEAAVKLMGI